MIHLLRKTNKISLKFKQFSILSSPKLKSTSTTVAKDGTEYMKKVDINKEFDTLSKAEKLYVKRLNELADKRYQDKLRLRKIARYAGFSLAAFAFSIYFYTMYAIKQEKFLDDFDLPDPVDQTAIKGIK